MDDPEGTLGLSSKGLLLVSIKETIVHLMFLFNVALLGDIVFHGNAKIGSFELSFTS